MNLSDKLLQNSEDLCNKNPNFANTYKKVRGKILGYARVIDIPAEELQFSHLINDRMEFLTKFKGYIISVTSTTVKNSEKTKKYQGEIYCNLRRLFRELLKDGTKPENQNSSQRSDSILERRCPDWMYSIRIALPRNSGLTGLKSPKGEAKLNYPLAQNAALLLEAILTVVITYNINSLNQLAENKDKIIGELKIHHIGNKFSALLRDFYRLFKTLNFSPPKPQPQSIKMEKWSPKFREQWENFILIASGERVPEASISAKANTLGIKLGTLTKVTIETYKSVLSIGFFKCQPLPDNWGVEDLLTVQYETTASDDVGKPKKANEYVERYNKMDQDLLSRSKRQGFSSISFINFTTALKSVAAFNGIFDFNDDFTGAYPQNKDEETKRLNKDKKKRLFSIFEVDEQIALLEIEFQRAANKGLFKYRKGIPKKESERAMRLCTFLPMFAVLRFIGVRQRNVRNLKEMANRENYTYPDGNIGLRVDGTLIIHYQQNETKNRKIIHHEFNSKTSKQMHEVLIRILKTYCDKVYPYVKRSAVRSMNRQLFAYRSQKLKGLVPFPDCARIFRSKFKSWVREFMSFEKVTSENYQEINPHFLRGLCADWLINMCNFSVYEAAVYLADDPRTLEREYLDRNRTHNATKIAINKCREMDEISGGDWKTKFLTQSETLSLRNEDLARKNAKMEEEVKAKDKEINYLKTLIPPEMLNGYESRRFYG